MEELYAAMESLEQRVRALEAINSGAHLILPEVKVRICNKSILVKIRCGKRRGVVLKILSEVENNLNFAILTFNSATFAANSALQITILAKMENETSCPSEEEIVTAIRDVL